MNSLYSKILGPQWDELHPSIQKLHCFKDGFFSAHGQFSIRQGRNILAHLMACLLRMPKEKETEVVFLKVTENNSGEHWVRTVALKEYASFQIAAPPNLLSERMGFVEIQFNLKADQGCLIYLQKAVRIRLFSKFISLPQWISPKVTASECPDPNSSFCKIQVEISFPLLGTLLKYGGLLQRDS
jgi:hypothetical protein